MIENNVGTFNDFDDDDDVMACDSNMEVISLLTQVNDNLPNYKLPSPSLLNYYQNLKNREIWIETNIGDSLDVVKTIREYNKQDYNLPVDQRKPIKIFLDTPGGSVTVMWSIIKAIKMSKTPVYTINFCNALSAGAHILAAGHKRFAMPGSTILIHSGSCAYKGTQEQAESAKKYYDSISKQADDQLLADTTIDQKTFKKKSPFDWYINTDEALQYNIIDKVITDFDEIM